MNCVDVTHPCPKNPLYLQGIFCATLWYEFWKSLEIYFKPLNQFESHS